jgi:[ribosomal protein S5]-alanine N-acetyltransferase
MKLAGTLIELREYEPADAEAMVAWTSDAEVVRFMTWETGDRPRAERFLQQTMATAAERPRSTYELAMIERSSGRVVGGAGLRVRNWEHRRADIGYVLRRDRWGRGYTTEAAGLLISLGFDLGMHRVEATCHPDNRGSSRVMEKAGMTYEGRMRHYQFVRGEWWDALLYAIMGDE